jgi:hypothetical protein
MFSRGEHRIVRTWYRRDLTTAQDGCAEITRLPWMYGYPAPAWREAPTVATARATSS